MLLFSFKPSIHLYRLHIVAPFSVEVVNCSQRDNNTIFTPPLVIRLCYDQLRTGCTHGKLFQNERIKGRSDNGTTPQVIYNVWSATCG